MCLASPKVPAVAQFCSIGAEFINVRVLWRVGAQILLCPMIALLKFMILKLNREVLGQVPSICHLVNFGL